jgi:hypothetical protein
MKFDTNFGSEAVGTAPVESLVIQFSFEASQSGSQQVNVFGPSVPNGTGAANKSVALTGQGLVGRSFTVGGATIFAGPREDPFFFDQVQFYKIFPDRNGGSTVQSCLTAGATVPCPQGFNTPGTDTYAGKNVLAIVVEIPKSTLVPTGSTTPGRIAFWATTSSVTGQ